MVKGVTRRSRGCGFKSLKRKMYVFMTCLGYSISTCHTWGGELTVDPPTDREWARSDESIRADEPEPPKGKGRAELEDKLETSELDRGSRCWCPSRRGMRKADKGLRSRQLERIDRGARVRRQTGRKSLNEELISWRFSGTVRKSGKGRLDTHNKVQVKM